MSRSIVFLRSTLFITLSAVLTVFSGLAHSSGFAIAEQSVSGLGNAFAGGAALAEDASTVFFNPAGMTRLKGQHFTFGGTVIVPSATFKNKGSRTVLGQVMTGGNGGDAGEVGVVPNFYFTQQINDEFTFGIGFNAPFGLVTDYDNGWVGRYHALRSEVKTVNINPSLAYKVNDKLSVGGGINIQYFYAQLTNAIDFGTIDALPAIAGGFGGIFGLTPQASDGKVKVSGDDWGIGFNLGALLNATDHTRIGLTYRSQIEFNLKGKAVFNVPTPAIPAATGQFVNGTVGSSITVPDSISASVHHQINSQWAVMADYTWTNWSKLEEIRFTFANPLQPDGVTTTAWRDTNRVAVGASFTPNSMWTFRTGLAFDESPIKNAAARTPRVPGEDRTWITLGTSYKHGKNMSIDLSYAHLFITDPKIRKAAAGEDAVRGALIGNYDADVDIFGGQATLAF